MILETIKGGVNVINLIDVVKDPMTKKKCIIMEYVDTGDIEFKRLSLTFSDFDIRYYMFELLKALDFVHSIGVFHRDIKPQNIMIDHPNRKIKLVDWGLAEFYIPGKEYNVSVATRYFKGPELLTNKRIYDYSLDIWSLGCYFAGLIFQRDYFFAGTDNND